MEYRNFGKTDLKISEVGFGAWAIGGPAMAGDVPIGWGDVDDKTSVLALNRSFELGVNFYDTADFYGLGHSEKLIGQVFGNRSDVVIATKVGHRLAEDQSIYVDYSKKYILSACEESLKRLKRDTIDYYQLHAARLEHLRDGACIEAMEHLQQEGKIKYWGLSLNTFTPDAEADFLLERNLGQGFQLVFIIINQKARNVIQRASEKGYGIIARMPLQFGLLTGKFTKETRFEKNDHRFFRLPPNILSKSLEYLEDIWPLADKYGISKTSFSMSYILSYPEISTVIPGIKTPRQAELNTSDLIRLRTEDKGFVDDAYQNKLYQLVDLFS